MPRLWHRSWPSTHLWRASKTERKASRSGVTGTPTFFIDGVRYDGSVSLPKMLVAIRSLHPELHIAEAPTATLRIPRIRWPREEER